ncbi:tripartite tricarboxylate transporter permease [Ancylobacter mangrovi]|uniref:Tripartite tricarboxylate transporter permease n=1 Tax=Ancylobacter mangrovi TaxID=2972472 RepID=A0A9X2PEQ1_9HYPH|nr:tripartite tricarboxylate transporter permease [Ancylobacter mangrovi]MCS0494793.1 tripartite tricarboxylate transporter permease [Ancylobacter mangrovi]MCS0502184.1 tripartite tricarboxylate transporter permease [Ancylobacter mangrovi]
MDSFYAIMGGFSSALTFWNIVYCAFGVTLGTVIGLLPGLGSSTGVALLLPLTLGLDPLAAMILLAGIYYGAQYGGTISSVLVATPGEASSVPTVLDGYKLARQGRGGAALAVAAIASFLAGTISIVFLSVLLVPLAQIALKFGPPETFALMLFGIISVVGLASGDRFKGFAMAATGVLISTIGIDAMTGTARFTFGFTELLNGFDFLYVVIGLFAINEVLKAVGTGQPEPLRTRFRDMIVTREDMRRSAMPIFRGGLLGFFFGIIPGAGATLASFFSYDIERRIARKKGIMLGTGRIEGVAGPEAANNSSVNGSFIPTLALGIPGSATTAILLGGFLLFGIQPGPLLVREQPSLVWGLVASFYVGNVLLLILNLPLAPVFALMLRFRYCFLYPGILVVSILGAYSLENDLFGIWIVIGSAALGLGLTSYGYPAAPLILGLVLGRPLETSLVQTSSMGTGSLLFFFERPIAVVLLALSLASVIVPPLMAHLDRQRKARSDQALARPSR